MANLAEEPMKKIATLLALLPISLLPFSPGANAQIVSIEPATKTLQQYELAAIDVTLKAEWKNPYASSDVALNLNIVSPSGEVALLPGFYVSGKSEANSLWRFHFAPKEVGEYQFSVSVEDDKKVLGEPMAFSLSASVGAGKGFLQVADAWSLKFDNGELFRGIGENFGWERRDNDDSKYFKKLHEHKRFNYDHMIPALRQQGANFIRTWMIYWNLPLDWKQVSNAKRYKNSTEQFNASGIKRMDELVALLKKNDVYLMLAIDSHAGFIGNAWDSNPYNKANGGFAESAQDFFANAQARQQYKDKLRYLVARWGYSPNIAAWEFFNEVDNIIYATETPIPDALVVDWHREMSEYLSSIDPYNHIITTSISHRDVAGLTALPHIDLNQRHMYKVTDQIPETLVKYSAETQKPYVIGEYGYEWDWSINFNEIKAEKIDDFKKGLWYGLFSPTPIAPMTWWWEFFDEHKATPYFARVREINDLMLKSSSAPLTAITVTSDAETVMSLGVNNGARQFIYLHNKTTKAIDVAVAVEGLEHKAGAQVQAYDPETGHYSRWGSFSSDGVLKVSLTPLENKILIVQ